MHETTHSSGKAIRDGALLAALLAGLNYVLAVTDPGWLALNPTPWLLLPLLIGARYGVTSGTVAGLATAAALILVRSRTDALEPLAFATLHRYPMTCLVILGFLAGELNHLLQGDSRQLHHDLTRSRESNERLTAEVSLLRETRHELQQSLALYNAPLACLDVELRKAILLPPDETFQSILNLVHRLAGVTSAAIYRLDGENLTRDASIHPTPPLAESLPLAAGSLAARALEGQLIAAVMDPLESSAQQPFLAAIPWTFRQHSGVLLIQDMPLEALEWHNLARIELILHWALTLRTHMEMIGHDKPTGRLMPLEDFMLLLVQALETEKAHALPSSVVRFDLSPDENSTLSDGRQILKNLPANALTSKLPNGSYVTLLPFTTDEDADTLVSRMKHSLPGLRTSHFVISSPTTAESLWSSLLQS